MNNTLKYFATGLISLSTLDFYALNATQKKAAPAQVTKEAAKTATLTIRATGFHNEKGKAEIVLYNSKAGFDKDKSFREAVVQINKGTATFTVHDLPPGVYAAAASHDENNNKKLDTNLMGFPQEGVGLSNNVKVSITNIPTFDKIKFNVNEGEQMIEFKIQY